MKVKTALISVSDKTGLAEFAGALAKNGVKIISSGGTFKALSDAGIKCVKVEDFTGFPEMLESRVKTLHPKIHAGILAKRNKEHLAQLEKNGFETIDLVVVNLYPFKETVSNPKVKLEDAVENIDIGGPTLIRAAAKNSESVAVLVEPSQYENVLKELKENNFSLSEKTLKELCVAAFEHTAFYDSIVSEFLRRKFGTEKFPARLSIGLEKVSTLRYGENPHQNAALYKMPLENSGIVNAKQLNGKELSFNNFFDADAAVKLAAEFKEPAAVIVKHANPCGAAAASTLSEAFRKALECDPESAFGGIIALNRECDLATAMQITAFFNEVIIAPSFEEKALKELEGKKNLRVLELKNTGEKAGTLELKRVEGGILVQESDSVGERAEGVVVAAAEGGRKKPAAAAVAATTQNEWKNVSNAKASKGEVESLEFAWKVAKHVKSNAIVIAKNNATIGLGVGQTSRIKSVELALKQAGKKAEGAVLASDGFFPFRDSIDLAAKAGIKAIVEPGGSVKDNEVVAASKEKKIALYFTGERHFRH
ncbi:MAG TPA: bifunctional phosphoribosylaminoimidazolecarboxamide formyltransferase/IMP cyclohydrolase [archaeon]|nr:bifunctional phosphoribosylaminoimidazolecarboxamide formyltransferase/IMP cyclohydrolase [archaeon]